MISHYWTVGLFLHKGTSPRTLTCFQERSVRAFVHDEYSAYTTQYVNVSLYNGRDVKGYISGLEYDLLKVVVQQMNMTLFHVATPKGFEIVDTHDEEYIS
jgi:hypothetical protein